MIISFYLALSWFVVGILFMLPKRVSIQHLSFVFLFLSFVNTNIAYLLSDPIHMYLLTRDAARYVSFSLYQSFIIPALLALVLNASLHQTDLRKKTTLLLISLCVVGALDFLSRYLNLITYTGSWQLPALVGYRLILFFLTLLAVQGFERMCRQR
ncbi:hypothetical protein [Tumebacillus flagellatus]|uniref:Uncharacterized protein n=1 Tax=Tumebacillus flagellatus TaxID=1157490 RepID=A0A074MA18_9BACL|nr:hypothetical protein [Tumebacillus flagellatus]KEO82807.1 hypothetical protein EL26_13755 [Tumebacillus flagellatus]